MKAAFIIVVLTMIAHNHLCSQTRCDQGADTAEIFKIVEEMPRIKMSREALLDLLNHSIDLSGYDLQTTKEIVVTCIVNCEGKAYRYRVMRPSNDSLEHAIAECLQPVLEWVPGKQRNQEVDVSMVLAFRVLNGKFAGPEPLQPPRKKRMRH